MQTEHFFAGIDAALAFPVRSMQEKLLSRGFRIDALASAGGAPQGAVGQAGWVA